MSAVPPDTSVVYASCTETGYEVLRRLLAEGVPVTEVVSVEPDRADRHEVSGYYSFEDVAVEHDIPVYYPEAYSMDTETDFDHFATLDADLLIVNGWQRLVPGEILETFDHALGNHGSAFGLPAGRGRSPLNWSLIEDLDRFLLSLITLDVGADSGQVVATRKFSVHEHDDIRTLYYKVAMTVQEMLLETMGPLLRGDLNPDAQSGDPTYYPKRDPEDGAINWRDSTSDVYNLVRAVTKPYPGAFTECGGERVMVWEARPFCDDVARDADPGRVVQTFDVTDDFVVATGDGTLLVTEWEADEWTPERGVRLASLGEHDRVDRYEHRHNLTSSDD
jgi:methionyl-tRNA formyltransferase